MLPLRSAVRSMKPYVPGRSLESVRRETGVAELIKLNQNENVLGPSPAAVRAAAAAAAQAHIYPEGTSQALREKLAGVWDLPADWFFVGNGSDEVFRLLAETYLEPGDRVVAPVPSFAGYPLVAELMGAEVVRVPLLDNAMDVGAMARAAADCEARIMFLCRPNSPTGGVFPEEDLHAVMPWLRQTLVVVDEAYREFDTTPFDSRGLVATYPNLVATRTFSKIYGMAGMRLGYGVMRPEVGAPLCTVRDPFSVNSLALAAGMAALDDAEHVERSRSLVLDGREFLSELFDRLGLPYAPSQANFVLFDAGRPAVEVYDGVLERGVLIRPCASFGLPTSLRVTVGTDAQNRRFARALEDVLTGRPSVREEAPKPV